MVLYLKLYSKLSVYPDIVTTYFQRKIHRLNQLTVSRTYSLKKNLYMLIEVVDSKNCRKLHTKNMTPTGV